jgi:hypothetical protein
MKFKEKGGEYFMDCSKSRIQSVCDMADYVACTNLNLIYSNEYQHVNETNHKLAKYSACVMQGLGSKPSEVQLQKLVIHNFIRFLEGVFIIFLIYIVNVPPLDSDDKSSGVDDSAVKGGKDL